VKTAADSVWCGAAALHAVRFIETLCRFSEGEWMGKPFVLQQWQRAFVANLYGWMRPDGTRRYRQAHLLVPRKSGKTEMAAALCLLHLLADDEETPEVVSIARDREQAKLCFKRARRMAEQEPQIKERIEVYQNRLVAPDSHGVYKTLSSDAPGAHGLSVSACIADEIHAMEDRRELWEAVMTSMGARRQPLIISITTSGVLRQSLEFDMFTYAQKICQRVIENPAFLPCLYYADADDDWLSPETWKKANPSLGSTVRPEWYEAEAKRAQDQPSYETPFRTYYLCQHVTAADRWIRMSDWDLCAAQIDESALKALPCYLGIDLGQTQDLSSIAAVWLDGDRLIVKCWNYAPEVGAAIRARRDGVPYLEWSQRGFLTLTEGDTTDYRYLLEQVERIAKENRVRLIGYDPYNAQNLANDLEHRGHKVVRVPQSYLNMSTPTRMFERAVTGKNLQHDGGPVLSWALSNACTETDFAGNPRVSKRRSVERVDPVIATIVALAASLHDEKVSNSPYEKRGLVWL
jgi:phage terminase large subunit-like protein